MSNKNNNVQRNVVICVVVVDWWGYLRIFLVKGCEGGENVGKCGMKL